MCEAKALRLDHWGVKQAMQHPLLVGKKPLGRGVFSAVFDGTRAGRVLKMTVDNISYWLFNDYVVGVKHRHFPRVTENFGEIGHIRIGKSDHPIYLYEMERLEKLEKLSPAKRLARLVTRQRQKTWRRHYDKGDMTAALELQDLIRDEAIPRSIKNALRQLEEFCCNVDGASLDLHMGNFMQRKNGELVLIDPLANMSIWRAAKDQLRRRGW